MITRKSWNEFKDAGLLWWINSLLHIFGWAIVFELEGENITEVYPARVKYRGFSECKNTEGYIKLSRYMKDAAA